VAQVGFAFASVHAQSGFETCDAHELAQERRRIAEYDDSLVLLRSLGEDTESGRVDEVELGTVDGERPVKELERLIQSGSRREIDLTYEADQCPTVDMRNRDPGHAPT